MKYNVPMNGFYNFTPELAFKTIEEHWKKWDKNVKPKHYVIGISGGVDSSVVAALLIKAIGKNLVCVHVNHGLLRKGESEQVIKVFKDELGATLIYVDASDRFLDALAGVGFVTPIFIALMGIGNGLGAGSASALSKYIGEGRKKKADNGSIHSIIITVLISILTTIFLMIFLKPILIAMGVGGTIGYALEYGTVISLGSILIILSNSLYGVLRGEGDANRSMYAMLFSSILNMVLDPIFIYGLNLGVEGAAIATVISLLLVNLILLYWFYIKKNTYLKPFLSNFKFNWFN